MKITSSTPYYKNSYSFNLNKNNQKTFKYIDFSLNGLDCLARNNFAFLGGKTVPTPVYAISQDNKIKRFETINSASRELNIPTASISKCLSGRFKKVGNYTFLTAQQLENQDDKSNVTLDDSSLKVARDKFYTGKELPVYAIDIDGTVRRFDSVAQAAKKLEVSLRSIYPTLSGRGHLSGDYVFVPASKIELRDEKTGAILYGKNRKPFLDSKVINCALNEFSNAKNAPICKIDCFGKVQRLDNSSRNNSAFRNSRIIRSLDDEIKISGKNIFVAENVIIARTSEGKAIYDDYGNFLYDAEKINAILEAFKNAKVKPVIAIDTSTGEISRYESISEAARKLGVSRQAADYALNYHKRVAGHKIEYFYPNN
ncbi:MAG: hypothetical protein IJ003_00785 [Candidatus Gastranaerophilales bacterium]|nr:hypothetical protein [Candidatus Gastranaerophilales bacterium]